ncbi:MAG: enoyl-CoA hydratase/isomerase family protein [Hyphomicrobiales bacterium]|nr:enoyl-CoA hydratase/isomerase family protein [Hyphomicrobiales bacterium]MCP5370384.1 enoyl-CoA hydratase/isomerase family protein [Hyphomicrobiales bacterium]
MTDTDPILYACDDGVAVATLNRPDKFNCVSSAMFAGLDAALDAAEADGARAMVVQAEGPHFCTGADLDEVLAARADPAVLAAFMATGHRVLRRLETAPLPVVAAVQGLALAGGLELALSCDVVFLAAGGRMGDQHAQFGLIPGWGGSQRLPRLVGRRRALDLMYSARWLDAETALAWGLANYVVPDGELRDAALAYARQAARRNPEGLRAMKRLALDGLEEGLDAALAREREVAVAALSSDNVGEGLDAFQTRREPVFK